MKKLLKLALINFAIIIIIFPILSFSQCVSGTISYPPPAAGINYESKNGFFCPTRGTFRSLIIYAEADYTSGSDPNPTNSDWPIHSFPVWAHNVLDVVQGSMTGELTKYYYQASSGQLNLLGDVLINPNDPSHIFKVPMSATEAADGDPHYDMLFPYINSVTGGVFATANGLSINDFDLWSATFSGSVKSFPSVETPHKFDCVYIVWRNRPVFQGDGNTGIDGLNLLPEPLFNWLSNIVIGTGSYNVMPLKCLRHEFGHPLFGDNTFHTAGEQARFTYDYWLDVPGGYSVMGLHGSSLMTWNGWDRQRMDWRPIGNAFNPSARNSTSSSEVDGDIDPINTSQAGDYILRDFATTGDALRIKIPFLNPSLEFPEFLWIENHQGALNNGIVFDQFQYQDQSCVTPFVS